MDALIDFVTGERIANLLRAVTILVVGIGAARLLSAAVDRFIGPRVSGYRFLLRRGTWYGLLFLVIASTLRQLGFDISVLVGAAGILTVAIGFASQTSASNLISGIFLLTERPFTVGDVITVGTTTGEVVSVDLLSVKLRTFDNLLVRVPNELMIKSPITNITAYPIRRLDIVLPIAFENDLGQVKATLLAMADQHPLVLDEPAPMFLVRGFTLTQVEVQLSVWAATAHFGAMRDGVHAELHKILAPSGLPARPPAALP